MFVFEPIGHESSRKNNGEIILKARAVSRGIAIGKVVCLHGRRSQFYRINLENSDVSNELHRFKVAVKLAKSQLKLIEIEQTTIIGQSKASIFDTQSLMLEDKTLLFKVENIIEEKKINAEWAVKIVADEFISGYKNIHDKHLRERYIDLEDVFERLQIALSGNKISIAEFEKHSIVAASDIKPSTLIELMNCQPQAIITEKGGWTSHTFILARELNLPAVTGLKGITNRLQTGDQVIVDGFNGQVILSPRKQTFEKYKLEATRFQTHNSEKHIKIKSPLNTLDGREITIRANVDLPVGYAKAKRCGAHGIGLYRSEFLFNRHSVFPTEQQQIEAYRKVGKLVGNESVRIRTFDLTLGQLSVENVEKEPNPALGMRGIRLGRSQQVQFRIQLRALLQAAAEYNIEIILPMISDVSEILETKAILEQEKLNLKKRKIKYGNPRIGAMIEVPAAIFMIEEIAAAVDFLSLGTNDLVQYLLAVDRDNESVADWFRTLHPAVLRSVKRIIQAAEISQIPLVICGEMAGSPVYAAVLVGLGATELSMNPNSISRVRETIAGIAFEEAVEIANRLLKCQTSDAAEQLVNALFLKNWSHLFSSELLPSAK